MKLLFALALVAAPLPALAQLAPTEADQRRACSHDAMHLCFSYIRDRGQMRTCMIAHQNELGPACRAVFDASMKAETAAPGSAH